MSKKFKAKGGKKIMKLSLKNENQNKTSEKRGYPPNFKYLTK